MTYNLIIFSITFRDFICRFIKAIVQLIQFCTPCLYSYCGVSK